MISLLRSPALKRAFDLVAGGVALELAAGPMIAIGLLLRLSIGSPVLYRQKRGGYRGETFEIYKFRTMSHAVDAEGKLLPDEQRLTRLGRFLRAASLDELPELFNVLKGDMSLVGPRPFIAEYLDRYTPRQARRHEVRPGITGWAQIRGRNAIGWEERFDLDLWYVDHWSLGLDLYILLATVGSVLRRDGISAEGHATMPLFRGSAPTS
jgi:sugar transferase EpsL